MQVRLPNTYTSAVAPVAFAVEDLTPLVVRRWRATLLEAGVTPTMVAKVYRLLRAILNTAVDDDVLERNPCRIRSGGDEKPAERPVLTVRQVQQLCMAVPPRFSAFIAVTTFGSLRWGEVTALRRADVDLTAGTVTVRAAYIERSTGALELGPPKSRASLRTVALPGPVLAMLAAHLDSYVDTDPGALVFTGPCGRPLRRSNFNKLVEWRRIVAELGVPHLHLHDLRHTGNTLAAGTPGTSTRDLMERMGHDTMRAALIYQHTSQDADRRIADSLAQRLVADDLTEDAQPTASQNEVTRLRAREGHDVPRPTRRSKTRASRTPGNTGVQVVSDAFAGVVQWQNISFPS
jgi:integrase